MKIKRRADLRRFGPEAKGKIEVELSNKTAISRSASSVSLNCEVCGLSFKRKASEAKRNAHHYCGSACFGVACRREEETACVVCKKPFLVKASFLGKITCCSDECRSAQRAMVGSGILHKLWDAGRFDGDGHPAAKIPAVDIPKIAASDMSNAHLGRIYGVTRQAIRRVKRKRRGDAVPASNPA